MDKPSLADRIIAPLTWLERSRGWRRRGLASLYLLLALILVTLGWRASSLWRLPNAPEPFDLARYGRVEVADADNAMVAYRAVIARFGDLDTKNYGVANARAWDVSDWAAADPAIRRWADDHRAALEGWLPANDRPDSLLVQPGELRMSTPLGPAQTARPYVRLALLEGSRLEQSGDLAGAWRMYRAALRASRHVARHGAVVQRLIAGGILRFSCPRIQAWSLNPSVTPELLRRAIGDVEACRAMTSPASEMVRAEYFSARASVTDTDNWPRLSDSGVYSNVQWYNQIAAGRWLHRFVRHEPERSARVLRLITAGYLAQCDRPPAARPPLLEPNLMIYAHDSQTPRPVRAISPADLESWARDSVAMDLTPFGGQLQGRVDAEAGVLETLVLRMAERAFAIEQGRPPTTYGELVGPYLKALPEGIGLGDPVPPE